MSFARLALRNVTRARPTLALTPRRNFRISPANFSAAASLSRDDIQSRVLEVLKGFEKVDPAKLSTSSSFTDDLGLDSLDAVEVVMAVEEEFAIEIPDAEADEIKTVQQAFCSYRVYCEDTGSSLRTVYVVPF
ncbi:acyl carrier protein [Leucogyrophana mollusca]|uniref:Acyl carrier protein n=1 Tax=Leucogyrophana mollusca TaxID=85980 RepID=A0ACB8BZC6_9AGAM|nr:acyl carrier protein [Leucogyrophana mollusca]